MIMKEKERRILILEDGSRYEGYAFGGSSEKILELVFNTSMAGYQEIMTDPSYTDQAVVMTYPSMGNYGINDEDNESNGMGAGAIIVREHNDSPSNFRSVKTLDEFMRRNDITGIFGVDTRALTMKIRDFGSCKAMLTGKDIPAGDARKMLYEYQFPKDQVKRVSTPKPYTVTPQNGEYDFHVAAIDCGIKKSIIEQLLSHRCKVSVIPYDSPFESIEGLKPDGIFISNGPGDPEDVKETISTVKKLHGIYPIFGICLGHQILALSYGASTYKLKFGHRGGNHPVKNTETGKVDITSQNHSYAVDDKTLHAAGLVATHINILDGTIEGIRHEKDPSLGIQYHPEAAPGPCDSIYLFDAFTEMMEKYRQQHGGL